MEIKVLGSGCSSCKKLEKNTLDAIDKLGIKAHVEKVTDMNEILAFGVMNTPALVIDNKIVMQGQVPNVKKLIDLMMKTSDLK